MTWYCSMKKTIISVILTAVITSIVTAAVIILPAGWYLGSYIADFALKRNGANPPVGYTMIMNQKVNLPQAPTARTEEWTIEADDGIKLRGMHFSPERRSHQWVILIHGYARVQRDTWYYAADYIAHGYEVLTPDLRACGRSEGDYITRGALESDDIVLWAKRIKEVDPEARIILHGVSMGAATAMLAGAKAPPAVTGIIEDCGYTSAEELFAYKMRTMFGFPEGAISPVLKDMSIVCRWKIGASLDDMNPSAAVEKIQVPMLFIHGDADQLIPYEMMHTLYRACGSKYKDMMTVSGAGHAAAYSADPAAYDRRVFAFADMCTKEKK